MDLHYDWEGMCRSGKNVELGAGIPGSSALRPLIDGVSDSSSAKKGE